jgi:methyl-accepting chemotaxis protein
LQFWVFHFEKAAFGRLFCDRRMNFRLELGDDLPLALMVRREIFTRAVFIMSLKLLTHGHRFRIYGLEVDNVASAMKRISASGTEFIGQAVRQSCQVLAGAPGVGEPFQKNGDAIAAILTRHYEDLLKDGISDAMPDRNRKTMKALVGLGTDLRCCFVMAGRICDAASRVHARRILLNGTQLLADLSVFQRLLACDAATALTASLGTQSEHETQRQTAIANELDQFKLSVADMSSRLEDASRAVESAANVVSSAAASALEKSRSAADAAEQGNTSLTASATSTEELSQATAELERRTENSRQAVSVAEGAVSGAQSAISDLHTAAEKIGSIVGLISNIAEQTNLLALNATIEAARAGDAGRGFAVVAQEVKALASQTTKATQDIVAQIAAVQDGTSRSVNEIGAIGAAMDRLSQNAGEVAGAVTQQNALTGELSRNLHETVRQVIAASEGYTAASTLIENTSAETAELQKAMATLAEIGASLKRDVDIFSERLKAA